MRTRLLVGLLGAGAVIAAVGCSGSSSTKQGVTRATLRRAQSCQDLEASLKKDALDKMNRRIDVMIQGAVNGWGVSGAFGAGATEADGRNAAPAPSATATDFSQTNTQVAGVDEADIVKNDGKYIYVLHGQSFTVVNAFPASQMAQAASIAIEGSPSEMFVDGGKVVIYSSVDGKPIYAAAGIKPRPGYYDGYGYAQRGVGAMGAMDCAGPGCGTYWENPLTKITVLTLDANATPTVQRELYFEGSYQSSRRVAASVRTILGGAQFGPLVKYWPEGSSVQSPQNEAEWRAFYEGLRGENARAIQASTVKDWLPYAMVKSGGNVTASLPACEDFYVPTAGTTEYGMTQIAAIDLSNPGAAPKTAGIFGAVDTIYSNQHKMVLAARAWESPEVAVWGTGVASSGTVGPAPAPGGTSTGGATTNTLRPQANRIPWTGTMTTTFTHLHEFDLDVDPTIPVYLASGTVAGQVKDQFSLDEKDGVLRTATTEQRITSDGQNIQGTTVSRVFTLGVAGDELKTAGDVGDLAPGERIYSVRFVGNRGYVVTFRQIDPLFVIDLSNAAKPQVLGALKIPGFSEYMHPIDDNHLLTIGRDVEGNARGGLMLQMFDVTDAMHPALKHKYVFDSAGYGYSEASYNPKAFTYYAQRKLLTFPFYAYTGSGMRSSAELFRIDVAEGIQKLGSVDHSGFFGPRYQGYCGGYYGPQVRRGVFMDDTLYSISYGGVVATDTKSLAQVNQLALPQPTFEGYGPCGAL